MKDGTFSYTLPVGESHLPEEARITVIKYMSTVVTSFCKLWSNEMHSAVSIYLQANITLVNPRHRLACDITGIIIVPLSDDDDAKNHSHFQPVTNSTSGHTSVKGCWPGMTD